MATIKLTFEVDTGALFDSVAKMNGDTSILGERLIGVMMTGQASFREQLGMSVYGISLLPSDPQGE